MNDCRYNNTVYGRRALTGEWGMVLPVDNRGQVMFWALQDEESWTLSAQSTGRQTDWQTEPLCTTTTPSTVYNHWCSVLPASHFNNTEAGDITEAR